MASSRVMPVASAQEESKHQLYPTLPAENSDFFEEFSDELQIVMDHKSQQRYKSAVSELSCDSSFGSSQADAFDELSMGGRDPSIRHISFAHEARSSQHSMETENQLSNNDERSFSKSPNPRRRKVGSQLSNSERSYLSPRRPRSSLALMEERNSGGGAKPGDPLSSSERISYNKSVYPRRIRRGATRRSSATSERSAKSSDFTDPLSSSERSSLSPNQPTGVLRSVSLPVMVDPLDNSERVCAMAKRQVDANDDGDQLSNSERFSRSPRSIRKPRRKRSTRSPRRTCDDDLYSIGSAGSCDLDNDYDDALSRSDHTSSFRDDGSTGHFSRRSRGRGNKVDDALSVSEKMMSTSPYAGKVRSVMDGLTINKLQYDKVGLVGREKETKRLMECYARLTNTTTNITDTYMQSGQKELVFVHGYSGVGKTSLVSSMLEVCDQSATGFCARGKFDFSSGDLPYAAFASAFGQILGDIERRGSLSVSTYDESGKLQTLGEALTAKLGTDVNLLATLIPKLKVMVQGSVPRKSSSRRLDVNGGFEANQSRWVYALRVLTRELNKIYSPLVLFLDDVHYADQSSLNLIDSLVSDVENENSFMVVGCYRSNAIGENHILPKKLDRLARKTTHYGFNLSDIKIGNLDQEGVHSITMSLLSMDNKEKTEALADICFKRTHGNPFFLIEFMTMLTEEYLIQFSLGSFTWFWDEEEVERETMSTENVVDIVHSRVKKLSNRAQQVLEYAACLGSTIRVHCLAILVSNLKSDQGGDDLDDLLHQLEKGGFIEQIEPTQYRWVHDNVRKSALMLGDAADRFFQFDVGNTLYNCLDDDELDEVLFEVCDLVNMGQHARRVEYAKLNLRAAEKARSISAFQSASLYVTKGIAYLPNDKWTAQHDLTLQLCILGMEMELATGQVEEMEKYSEEILAQPDCTAIEKLPVYLAKSHRMTHMDIDHKGCTDLLQRILSEKFGIRLFKSKAVLPIQAIAKLVSVARTVKKLPRGALANLQPVDDSNLEAAMDLLVRLAISSYAGKNMLLHISCITKMVQMTLKHGVHPMSGYSFVGLGTCLMIVNGDVVEGATIANMANELQEVVPDDYAAASTTTISNSLVLPWSSTLPSCRSALREGHISGMRSGNTESAMLSLMMHSVVFPLMMGKPLASIESICGTIAAQCEELKLGLYSVSVRQHWELILELMGQPDSSVFSNSEVLQKEGWKPEQLMTEYIGLHVSIYSGDYESASTIALNMGDGFQKANPSNVQIMSETFLRAIALYATASSGSSKSKRTANKLKQKMGNWVSKGNPNIGHCYHLLCAEKARLDGKYEKANTLYNDAIVLAARTGHVHHAALSNESTCHRRQITITKFVSLPKSSNPSSPIFNKNCYLNKLTIRMKFSVAFLFTLLVGGTCAQNNGSTATGQSDLLEKRAVFQKEADEDAYAAFDSSEANNSDRQRKKVYHQQSALQRTLDENVTKQRRRAKKSKSSKKSSSKSSQVFFYAPVGAAPVRPVSQPVAAPVRVPYVVPIRAPDSPRITSPVAVNIGTTRGIPGGSSSSSSFKGFAYRAQFASVAPVAGPTGSTGSIYVEATAEDCQSINNGGLVEGQKFMGSSTFTFGFNLAMPEGSTNIETIAATARAALQALVVQRVINCSGFRRHLQKRAKRHHRRNKEQRRLNNGLPSGIVGNAQIGDVECTLSADGTSADCTTSVDIALKGPAEEALIKAEIIAALDEGDILSDTELGTIAEGFTHTEVTHVETTEPQIGGDPHIVTWKGEHYEYHGQCDMVMVNDPLFADNAGLDIHIRTKLVRFWSYIKNVSIRIGSDILEIVGNPDIKSREPMYWVNYEYMGDLDTIGGFPITYVATSGSKSVYEIDLSSKYPNAKIIIKIYKEFLRIKMEGKEEVWGNTVGLLGDYHTGETIGRDGVSVFDDYYKFGSEWQVNPTDPKLFQTLETPQYPEKCMLPDNPSGDRRRRLDEESVSMEEAEKACSTLKDPKQVKDCVYDILATQDLDMVGAF